MELWIGVVIALVLCVVLFVPYFIKASIRGKTRGRTWFTWWKPLGHSDIGPDLGGTPLTRRGADDARGDRY
jgi:hypothetical protein